MSDSKGSGKGKAGAKRQMLVYLPDEKITALKIAGVEDRVPVSSIVEGLVDGWLRRRIAGIERKGKPKSGSSAVEE